MLLEQEVNEIMSGCHPSFLKTVSQQVVCRIRTHSLRFLTPNTAILVGIIQIHTNFGTQNTIVFRTENVPENTHTIDFHCNFVVSGVIMCNYVFQVRLGTGNFLNTMKAALEEKQKEREK